MVVNFTESFPFIFRKYRTGLTFTNLKLDKKKLMMRRRKQTQQKQVKDHQLKHMSLMMNTIP